MPRSFRGIFVEADDPAFLERRIEPQREVVDLNAIDVKALRESMQRRAADFDTTPFDPAGDAFRLYPGGFTVWSGFPGAGKTTLLRQFVCHLLARERGVFVASLEEDPLDVFQRLSTTALGVEDPNDDSLQCCIDLWCEKLRLWHAEDTAEAAKLLAAIRVLARGGVRHAIIDSLMCLDVANDDWDAQRRFANAMRVTAKAAKVHIHLVAHPRKPIGKGQEPDLNDVAGAREIGGLADNVLFVRRSTDDAMTANADVTPMQVLVLKQRYYRGALGHHAGWFHRNLRQFKHDKFDAAPTRYLPEWVYNRPFI